MRAWKITQTEGGYTVDCVDSSTGRICEQLGLVIVRGGTQPVVYPLEKATALAAEQNEFERQRLARDFAEYVARINQPTPAQESDDDGDTYKYE